jgi:tetratricopeptide (TPR) repeat protein/tRNA A-37 threonylcarbamoyl transferase component Bud32
MIDEPATQGDEYCAVLLAACDDALVAGEPSSILESAEVPPELRRRLERAMASVRLLRQSFQRRESVTSTNAPLPWTTLGRFEIRRELGRGAYGIVYLAYDPQLRREVALKVPRPESIVTPELRDRFLREAQAAASLEHPNLVPVYEVGEVGPVCYLASAYCPGQTLAAWLKEQRELAPWRDAALLMATLADAVQHAHDRGVLHRDLKPSNILLTQVQSPKSRVQSQPEKPWTLDFGLWTPKITDFGLAKFLSDAEQEPTRSGTVLGTAAYMAPEQATGHSRQVGRQADVYALGVILYELLTGRPPFQADSMLETLEQVRTHEPAAPRRLRPRLPADLETVCLKCLEKEPGERYQSAGELAEDLRRYLRGEPILARPVSALNRAVRWCRRNPVVAGLLGAVAMLLFVLAVGNRLSAYRLQQQALEADDQAERVRLTELERKKDLDTLLDRAATNAGYRRWNLSLPYLNQAVESRPDSSLALTRRGQFYGRFYLWDLAAPDFRAAFVLQPSGDPHLWLRYAALCLHQGEDSAYQETCRRMLEQFGASPNAEDQLWLVQACCLGPGGLVDRERLRHLAEQCLELRPNDRGRQLVLGTLYYRAGQLDRAISLLQDSLADNVDSLNLEGWPVLAMACQQAGRSGEARQWMEKTNQRIEQLTSNFPIEPLEDDLDLPRDSEWLLAALLRREAQGLFGGPTNADLVLHWLVQSRGLAKLGRWDEAQAAFTKVIELRPNQGRFRLDRAHFFGRRNQWHLAAADFEDAYRLGAPDRVFDWYCYAICRLRMEDHEGYRRICRDVLRRFGGRPKPKTLLEVVELYEVACICFLRPNADADLELATRLAKTALAVHPDDALLLLGLSGAYIRSGAPAKAIPIIHKTFGKHWSQNMDWGGPVIAWLQLSLAHHQLGQVEAGRVWLNKAIQRIDGDASNRESEATGIRWYLWALLEITRREAAGLYAQAPRTPAS